MKKLWAGVMLCVLTGLSYGTEERVVIGKAIVTSVNHIQGLECEPLLIGYFKAEILFNRRPLFSSKFHPGQLSGLVERQVTVFDGKHHHAISDEYEKIRNDECLIFISNGNEPSQHWATLNSKNCKS